MRYCSGMNLVSFGGRLVVLGLLAAITGVVLGEVRATQDTSAFTVGIAMGAVLWMTGAGALALAWILEAVRTLRAGRSTSLPSE